MSRVKLSHPRRSRLLEWLETGDGDRITQHVEHCDRCARVLEELSVEPGAPELEGEAELGAAIREAMSPPANLNERVLRQVEARQRAERELSLFLGLIAIPRDAVDLMMDPEPPGTSSRPAIDPAHGQQREEEQ